MSSKNVKGKSVVRSGDSIKIIMETPVKEEDIELVDIAGDDISLIDEEEVEEDNMTIVTNDPGASMWSNVDSILRNIAADSKEQAKLYKAEYLYILFLRMWFGIPIIVLSIINSVLTAGGQNFIQNERALAYSTCGICVLICIIQSARMLVKIDERADNYQTTFKNLQRLYIEVATMLKISRHNRTSDPEKVKNHVTTTFQDILQKAMEPIRHHIELSTDYVVKVKRAQMEANDDI